MGVFGDKYALFQFRGSYLAVDIDDMRPENSLFELIGRDGELQLHVPSEKFPIHYLVDSQALILLSGNGKWGFKSKSNDAGGNTDTRLTPKLFTNRPLARKLLFASWGVNDFAERLGGMNDSKREKGIKESLWSWNH